MFSLLKTINLEFKNFIFIGLTSVSIDFLFYQALLNLCDSRSLSKGISFILGALFAYFANKKWTFNAKGGQKVFLRFVFIYTTALFLNISLNNQILSSIKVNNFLTIFFAFIISTFFSALFNFLGLKKFVFTNRF